MTSQSRPMRLLRIPEPFDHPEFIFELKLDGFRALAHVHGHRCELVSRNGHRFTSWPQLAEEIAPAVNGTFTLMSRTGLFYLDLPYDRV